MVGNQVSEDKDSAGALTTEGAVTGRWRGPFTKKRHRQDIEVF